jgi:hypothetical protein
MTPIELDRATLLSFFDEEVNLFARSWQNLKQPEALKAACHAALWAWTLDEHLRKTKGPAYDGPKGFICADPAGAIALGLRCARQRLFHHAADLMQITHGWATGLMMPGGATIPASEVSWRPLADLPTPPARHRNASLDRAYRTRLEGQLVRGTFADALGFFRHVPP